MRTVKVKVRKDNYNTTNRLFVKPESFREKVVLFVRGYRTWKYGIIAGSVMVYHKYKDRKEC
jgi:hypothetical protein